MKRLKLLFLCPIFLSMSYCSWKPITKAKGIVYEASSNLKLDVYAPKRIKSGDTSHSLHKVLIFIHGGNWTSGKRSLYTFFGKGMARKHVVSVIIDYRLSPITDYLGMARDAAKAATWVHDHIRDYGGDSTKIFISGHSAGAHLAALISLDTNYFKELNRYNPVKGIILIDPFGLDMYSYLQQSTNKKDSIYYPIFSTNTDTWKKASPRFYLKKEMPPFLLFLGSKTYPAIKKGTTDFLHILQPYQPETGLIEVKGKRHAAMIFQFYNLRNKAYKDILDFMDVR